STWGIFEFLSAEQINNGTIKVQDIVVTVEMDERHGCIKFRQVADRKFVCSSCLYLNRMERMAAQRNQIIAGVFQRRESLNVELKQSELHDQFANGASNKFFSEWVCHIESPTGQKSIYARIRSQYQ